MYVQTLRMASRITLTMGRKRNVIVYMCNTYTYSYIENELEYMLIRRICHSIQPTGKKRKQLLNEMFI